MIGQRNTLFGLLIALALMVVGALSPQGALAATLYITEFASPISQSQSSIAQNLGLPAISTQTVAIGASSAQSAAFSTSTRGIQVYCDTGCSVAVGANPTATTSTQVLTAGQPQTFTVLTGQKIAVIANPSGNAPGSGGGTNLQVGGYEFNASVLPTVQNAAYAAGQSLGGLQTLSIGSTSGLSGILTQITIGSKGGSTAALAVYVWSKNPTSTTCTDKTNFAVNQADNQNLVVGPQAITPALAVTAQDTSTYGSAANLVGPFVNGSANTNLYACILANAAVTPASVSDLRLNLAGIKDQP